MASTVYLKDNSNCFEYFICNFPDDDKKSVCISNAIVISKAFKNSDSIENVFLEKCELIQESSFENCKDLRNIIWREKNRKEESTSLQIKNLHGINLLSINKITIQHESFKNCTKMQTLILPVSKEISIEKDAFKGCSTLRTVVACSDTIHFTENPFEDCPEELVFICYKGSAIEQFARENGYRWINV